MELHNVHACIVGENVLGKVMWLRNSLPDPAALKVVASQLLHQHQNDRQRGVVPKIWLQFVQAS